jgi:hypothetical protein
MAMRQWVLSLPHRLRPPSGLCAGTLGPHTVTGFVWASTGEVFSLMAELSSSTATPFPSVPGDYSGPAYHSAAAAVFAVFSPTESSSSYKLLHLDTRSEYSGTQGENVEVYQDFTPSVGGAIFQGHLYKGSPVPHGGPALYRPSL